MLTGDIIHRAPDVTIEPLHFELGSWVYGGRGWCMYVFPPKARFNNNRWRAIEYDAPYATGGEGISHFFSKKADLEQWMEARTLRLQAADALGVRLDREAPINR